MSGRMLTWALRKLAREAERLEREGRLGQRGEITPSEQMAFLQVALKHQDRGGASPEERDVVRLRAADITAACPMNILTARRSLQRLQERGWLRLGLVDNDNRRAIRLMVEGE